MISISVHISTHRTYTAHSTQHTAHHIQYTHKHTHRITTTHICVAFIRVYSYPHKTDVDVERMVKRSSPALIALFQITEPFYKEYAELNLEVTYIYICLYIYIIHIHTRICI